MSRHHIVVRYEKVIAERKTIFVYENCKRSWSLTKHRIVFFMQVLQILTKLIYAENNEGSKTSEVTSLINT